MRPVNRAGSVSEMSPHYAFLCKIKFRCVHMRRRASPDTDISVFATEISVTGLEISLYEHSSLVTGMKLERSRLVHLGNRAEISHMNSNRAEISAL